MFLDNLLPSYFGIFGAPVCFIQRIRHPHLVSFGLLANLSVMRSRSIISNIDSIWDAGANEGQFAFMVNTIWPELPIYSFEPDPTTYSKLSTNFNKHKIPGRVFSVALAEKVETRQFVRYEDNVNNSFLNRNQDAHLELDTIEVMCTSLDLVSMEMPEVKNAFLKLDVQGFELAVLAGAKSFLKNCRFVLIEVSLSPAYTGGAYADEIMLAMRSYGFECIQILDLLRRKSKFNEILEADLLFRRMV